MAVTTTILDAVGAKTKLKDAQARAKVVATWIEIARVIWFYFDFEVVAMANNEKR